MEIEKETRFEVDDQIWENILLKTEPFLPKKEMLDITMGMYGRESLSKTGKVFRVRQKGEKVVLGVKSRQSESDWLEEEIELKSVAQGVNFLYLAGMQPYLYLHRHREVKKYNNLKVFFDDFELLGKYIEIEYQDSPNGKAELDDFIKKFNITTEPADLYGAIVFKKCNSDKEFNDKFTKKLNSLIEEINNTIV